jgi:diguanylate cyclase (GGDEF)-like protein
VVDVDHFKSVNDTLGHNAGDELIVSITGVLRGRLRTSDVLARLGGDEFAVLLPKADEAEAAQVAEALAKAVRSNTALLGGERKKITTSIGVAMFNTSVEELTGETIVIEADLAMYDAKEAGGDGHAFYAVSEHRVSRTKARLTWVSRIEQALEEDCFALLAQPILDLHTGEVRAGRAWSWLKRWRRERRQRVVSPSHPAARQMRGTRDGLRLARGGTEVPTVQPHADRLGSAQALIAGSLRGYAREQVESGPLDRPAIVPAYW